LITPLNVVKPKAPTPKPQLPIPQKKMNYTYIIIEDRIGSQQNLLASLAVYRNFICKGTASTLQSGISLALTQKPNIIFLDVELGTESGFDVIKEIRPFFNNIPYVIMTTDFDKYAKKAVNNDVLYFLDKPIDPDELVMALAKFEKRFSEQQKHITIKDKSGHYLMQYADIMYIEANDNYIDIHRTHEKKNTITKTLKEIELLLPDIFLRVHKSYIINTKFVDSINTTQKTLTLNAKTGLIEFDESSKSKVDEKLKLKETIVTIQIGDLYLEKVKNILLTARSA